LSWLSFILFKTHSESLKANYVRIL
jgi:hypothetical protein